MESVIEEMIKERPHLIDPLSFYDKALRFFDAAERLPLLQGSLRASYPRQVLNTIFERFSSFLALPEGHLSPLKQAMELGEIDFTRLPLGETPAFSLPYPEDDLTMLLFLMSKPYFLALREASPMDNRTWEGGKCPLCGGLPSLSWIGADDQRLVSCSYCGTQGYGIRSGCQICRSTDAAKQNILVYEREDGFQINTCDLCRSYVKTVDADLIARITPDLADLIGLPLDIIVQEKGYVRRSPNPLGMRKMSTRG